jgi:hypothetical protein
MPRIATIGRGPPFPVSLMLGLMHQPLRPLFGLIHVSVMETKLIAIT